MNRRNWWARVAFDHIHPDDLNTAKAAFESVLAEPDRTITLHFRFRHKDGSWRHLEAIGQNRLGDPEISGIVINSRDASDRWRVEEELRNSEKQYRLLFQGNPNPMWVFNLETLMFLEVNDAAVQHYGYSREEFLAMAITDIRAPEKAGEGKAIELASEDDNLIWRLRRKDGGLMECR